MAWDHQSMVGASRMPRHQQSRSPLDRQPPSRRRKFLRQPANAGFSRVHSHQALGYLIEGEVGHFVTDRAQSWQATP